MSELQLGDPVILTQTVDNLKEGTVGMLNSIMEIEGIEYALFMPANEQKSYALRMANLDYLDEDQVEKYPELKALLEIMKANQNEE